MKKAAALILLAACAAPPKHVGRVVTPTEALLEYYAFCVGEFRRDVGRFPATVDELYSKPKGMLLWKGPYLDGGPPPLDDWKRPVAYETDGTGFTLRSAGPDGVAGTGDDLAISR